MTEDQDHAQDDIREKLLDAALLHVPFDGWSEVTFRAACHDAEVPEVLERHPEIRAFTLWDSVNGGCDYRFERVPVVLDAVRAAGLRPRLDTGAVVP